jgi:nitrogen regulatory protein PII
MPVGFTSGSLVSDAAGSRSHWKRGRQFEIQLDRHEKATGRDVKQVVAIVKPFVAEKVLEALRLAPIEALTVREVKGYGRQKNYLSEYRDTEFALAFLPKVEITVWVDEGRCQETIERIENAAQTGRMGDGKIFVLPCGIAMPADID